MHFPPVYEKVAPGPRVTAARIDGAVQVDVAPLYGVYSYQLGQIEGVVGHFGRRARIDIFEDEGSLHARFVVHLE